MKNLLLSFVFLTLLFATSARANDWKMTCYLQTSAGGSEVLDVFLRTSNLTNTSLGLSMNFRGCSKLDPAWFDMQLNNETNGKYVPGYEPVRQAVAYDVIKSPDPQAAKYPWCGDQRGLLPSKMTFTGDSMLSLQMQNGIVYSGPCERFDL